MILKVKRHFRQDLHLECDCYFPKVSQNLGGTWCFATLMNRFLKKKLRKSMRRGKAIGLVCDVRDYNQVCLARDTAVKTFGSIDVMANFAGF